jgi:hypothetical protein
VAQEGLAPWNYLSFHLQNQYFVLSLLLFFQSFISLACANSETISETVQNLHVWKIV